MNRYASVAGLVLNRFLGHFGDGGGCDESDSERVSGDKRGSFPNLSRVPLHYGGNHLVCKSRVAHVPMFIYRTKQVTFTYWRVLNKWRVIGPSRPKYKIGVAPEWPLVKAQAFFVPIG